MKYILGIVLCSLLLSGCAGVSHYLPAPPARVSAAEEGRVGDEVAGRLLQMLGGPYFDKPVAGDLNRLARAVRPDLKVFVADKSARALYPLPGGRVVLTRGLLAGVSSRQELDVLVNYAGDRSVDSMLSNPTRASVTAVEEVLAGKGSLYDPDSAAIRLARSYQEQACEEQCLAAVVETAGSAGGEGKGLPASIMRLADLQGGFELLAEARQKELGGQRAEAIATYLQAATQTVDEPRILGLLGMAYLRSGDVQSARLHLQKSVKLQPQYYRTQMGLGYLYLQQGKISLAKEKLAASVRLLPVAENIFLLAEAMEKSNDLDGAQGLYRMVVDTDRYSKLGRTAASRLKVMGQGQ